MAEQTHLPIAGEGGMLQPEQDSGAQSAAARRYTSSRNRTRLQPMIRSQIESAKGGKTCYIYNISRIFSWSRQYSKLGTFLIQHAPRLNDLILKDGKHVPATQEDINGDYRLSTPIVINHSYQMSYDKGDTRRVPYIEFGEDIAEALVGNSKLYPVGLNDETANLANWGVFITYGKPFEKLSREEQSKLLVEAQAVHQRRLFEKVQNGDRLYDMSRSGKPVGPLEIHRMCAQELGEERQWVKNLTPKVKFETIECPFCTSEIKPTAIVCPQCHNIVNQAAYDKKMGKKKTEE